MLIKIVYVLNKNDIRYFLIINRAAHNILVLLACASNEGLGKLSSNDILVLIELTNNEGSGESA